MKLSKVERRRVKARFRILSLPEWTKARGLKAPFPPGTCAQYRSYKARREIEAAALGLKKPHSESWPNSGGIGEE